MSVIEVALCGPFLSPWLLPLVETHTGLLGSLHLPGWVAEVLI